MFMSSGSPGGGHYLYREDDLVQNRTCGVPGPSEHRTGSIAAAAHARGARVSCGVDLRQTHGPSLVPHRHDAAAPAWLSLVYSSI